MEWISVKDRLPENDIWYLVCINRCLPFAATLSEDGIWQFEDESGNEENCTDVTHWMPLPEPPIK